MTSRNLSEQGKNERPPAARWRLWVDGCGGFLLLSGDQWSVGGFDPGSKSDVCVRADWPRHAGVIDRESADYFWQSAKSNEQNSPASSRQLLISGKRIPITGSAQMFLTCPNPLTSSAVLTLAGPHRFDGHVDAVILSDHTLLFGPGEDCHLRTHEFPDRGVLVLRDGIWQARLDGEKAFRSLPVDQRCELGSIAMTLEAA